MQHFSVSSHASDIVGAKAALRTATLGPGKLTHRRPGSARGPRGFQSGASCAVLTCLRVVRKGREGAGTPVQVLLLVAQPPARVLSVRQGGGGGRRSRLGGSPAAPPAEPEPLSGGGGGECGVKARPLAARPDSTNVRCLESCAALESRVDHLLELARVPAWVDGFCGGRAGGTGRGLEGFSVGHLGPGTYASASRASKHTHTFPLDPVSHLTRCSGVPISFGSPGLRPATPD